MPVYLHHIATGNPPHAYSQSFARDRFKSWTADTRAQRLIHAIYSRSGIETRYSVCGDFAEGGETGLFQKDPQGGIGSPGTAERNAAYAQAAGPLAVNVARRALAESGNFAPADITHVVYASCTGFANPGPDLHLVRDLGLRPGVERYLLGFMGCYAALPALRMARQFCQADPRAVVLVVCLELCSLHLQIDLRPDTILANSLFADGAAAAIVSARSPANDKGAFELCGFESALLSAGEADMAWDIGNHGFNIVLSSYVPQIIGANIRGLLEAMLERHNTSPDAVSEWAVHPGGRSILDKVQESLELPPHALAASRAVLRNFGNMSSATILFVLKAMLEAAETETASTCAIAFGPGLTLEAAVLERVQGPVRNPPVESAAPGANAKRSTALRQATAGLQVEKAKRPAQT